MASEFLSLLEPRKKQKRHVIRVRGLPWSACGADVIEIFPNNIKIYNGEAGVHFTLTREGRSSGEAYIELENMDDFDRVLNLPKKDLWIGKRYIEVFKSTTDEMEYVLEKAERQANQPWDNVIRVKGLPFKCNTDMLRKFFKSMEIATDGILLMIDSNGKNTGDAYIQFTSQEHAEQALMKHKEAIEKRYIEVYKASRTELTEQGRKMKLYRDKRCFTQSNLPQPTPSFVGVGPDGVYCHLIQMRGLPFKATEKDIRNFFDQFQICAVQFEFGIDGRPTGRATVAFPSHKLAQEAMQFDKCLIGNRYIELFLKSTECKPPQGIGPNGQYLFMLQMRGLPFKVTGKDIYKFFSPIPILAWSLEMGLNGPNGAARIAFHSQDDLKSAFQKDKEYIGDRYVELLACKPFNKRRPHA